jgi:[ribosomal protein S18]-alanine N-acetyltransferase
VTPSVRTANIGDLPALARLHAQCFAEAWSEESLAGLIFAARSFALIADPAAGFILIRVAADEAEILSIGVIPNARRHGLGSALLDTAAVKARDMGAQHMFLEVVTDNLAAKNLYESHGFQPVGMRKAYYRGSDAMVLKAGLPLVGKSRKTL